MKKGSKCFENQILAVQIHDYCIEKKITLDVAWISKNHNAIADFYSKDIDYDDWTVKDELFNKLQVLCKEKFTLDAFATCKNTKCRKFYSRFYSTGCLGVNALKHEWNKSDFCWVVPPPRIALKALLHFKACKAKGVFIVPYWQSASYWPILNELSDYSLSKWDFPGKIFINPGDSGNDVFKNFNGVMCVYYFNFDLY